MVFGLVVKLCVCGRVEGCGYTVTPVVFLEIQWCKLLVCVYIDVFDTCLIC